MKTDLSGVGGGWIFRNDLKLGAQLIDVCSFDENTIERLNHILQNLCFAFWSECNTVKRYLSSLAHNGLGNRCGIVRRCTIRHEHDGDLLARLDNARNSLQRWGKQRSATSQGQSR